MLLCCLITMLRGKENKALSVIKSFHLLSLSLLECFDLELHWGKKWHQLRGHCHVVTTAVNPSERCREPMIPIALNDLISKLICNTYRQCVYGKWSGSPMLLPPSPPLGQKSFFSTTFYFIRLFTDREKKALMHHRWNVLTPIWKAHIICNYVISQTTFITWIWWNLFKKITKLLAYESAVEKLKWSFFTNTTLLSPVKRTPSSSV